VIFSKDIIGVFIAVFPFMLIFFPLLGIIPIHEHIIIQLVIIICLIYAKKVIKLNGYDISILFFLFINYLSISWATNNTLAIQSVTFLTSSILVYFHAKFHLTPKIFNSLIFKRILTVFCLYFFLIGVFGLNTDLGVYRCSKLFSKNCNYTTSFGLCIFPLILFASFEKYYKVTLNILLLSSIFIMSYLASVRGTLIVFILVLGLVTALFSNKNRSYYKKNIIVFSFIFLGFFIALYYNFDLPIIREFGKSMEVSRFNNQILSWFIFSDHPILGVGAGNWITNVYEYDLSAFRNNLYYNVLLIQQNHNYFTSIVCENGIMAMFLFVPVIIVLARSLRSYLKLSSLSKAALLILISYIIFALIYRTANSQYTLFSRVQALGFVSLAILTRDLAKWEIKRIYFIYCISLFGLVSIGFQSYYFFSNKRIGSILNSEIEVGEKLELIGNLKSKFYNTYKSKIPLDKITADLKLMIGLNPVEDYKNALTFYPKRPDIIEPYIIYLLDNFAFEEAIIESNKLLGIRSDYNEALAFVAEAKYDQGNIDLELFNTIKKMDAYHYSLPYKSLIDFLKFEYKNYTFLKNKVCDANCRQEFRVILKEFNDEKKILWDSIKSLKGKRKRDSQSNREKRTEFKKFNILFEDKISNSLTVEEFDLYKSIDF